MKAGRGGFHLKSSSSPRGRPCACKIHRNPPEKSLVDYISGLGAFGFGAGMIDVLDGEIKLVVVMLGVGAIFGSAIGQQALQLDALLVEEGDDAIVQEIGGGQRCFSVVE